MTHSTLLTLLLTTPFCRGCPPLGRTSPPSPPTDRTPPRRLPGTARHARRHTRLGTPPPGTPPPRRPRPHSTGASITSKPGRCPKLPAPRRPTLPPPRPLPQYQLPLFGPVRLWRHLYEDLEPGNPCLFPLERRLKASAAGRRHTRSGRSRASWWLAQHPQGGTLDLLARDHDVGWSAETLRNVERGLRRGPGDAPPRGPSRADPGVAAASLCRTPCAAIARRWWWGVTAFTCPCVRGRLTRKGRRRR